MAHKFVHWILVKSLVYMSMKVDNFPVVINYFNCFVERQNCWIALFSQRAMVGYM